MSVLSGGRARAARRLVLAALAGGALALAAPPAARAQAQVLPVLSSLDFAGQTLTLGGDPATVDWVKWGYPIIGGGDGPFSAQDLVAAPAFRRTRKAGGAAAIGALSPVVPAGGSTSEPYWAYTRDGDARFVWSDGDPEASPTGVEVRAGVAVLPTASHAHAGFGFQLDIASSEALRDLDLYLGCPQNADPNDPLLTQATVTATLGTIHAAPLGVCRDPSKRVQKVTVTFARAASSTAPLSLIVTTDDQALDARRSIVLLAAVLRPTPAPPDAGSGGTGGLDGGTGGAAGTGGSDADSPDTRPDPNLAERPTACATAGSPPNEAAAPLATAAFALAAMLTRPRPFGRQ